MDRRNVRKRAVKKVNAKFTAFGSNLGETDYHGAAVHDEEPSWFDVSQDDALSESESEGEHEEDDGSISSLTEFL